MKKNVLLLVLISMASIAHGQINPWNGIFDIDSCKFETTCSMITLDTSSQDIWQIGLPSKPFFDTAYSIPYAIMTDTINPYAPSNHSYFDLKIPMDFNALVGFKHKFQTDSLIDGGYIELSIDSGQTWTNVIHDTITHPFEFHSENLYTDSDTLKGGIPGFSGTSDGWIYTRIQWIWAIPVRTNYPDSLILRFNFISDSVQTNKDGWIIDDVKLSFVDEGDYVKEVPTKINYKVLPNPFHSQTVIKFDNLNGQTANFKLYNSMGKLVEQNEEVVSSSFTINRKNLSDGIYFFYVYTKSGKSCQGKLIVE